MSEEAQTQPESESQETVSLGEIVIEPTIGRRVHFYPNGAQLHSTPYELKSADGTPQPMDAGVVYVWNDRMVNLHVSDHIGQVHAVTSVTLRQPDDAAPANGVPFCEWMPYQVSAATK